MSEKPYYLVTLKNGYELTIEADLLDKNDSDYMFSLHGADGPFCILDVDSVAYLGLQDPSVGGFKG